MTSKRAQRRARGRKIKARRPYSSAALALAAVFKADAKRAAAFRPFAERLAVDFVRNQAAPVVVDSANTARPPLAAWRSACSR